MTTRQSGNKRTVWFSSEQIEVMDKILEIDPRENISSSIRKGLKLYLKELETKESK
jgi:hypothetical protein